METDTAHDRLPRLPPPLRSEAVGRGNHDAALLAVRQGRNLGGIRGRWLPGGRRTPAVSAPHGALSPRPVGRVGEGGGVAGSEDGVDTDSRLARHRPCRSPACRLIEGVRRSRRLGTGLALAGLDHAGADGRRRGCGRLDGRRPADEPGDGTLQLQRVAPTQIAAFDRRRTTRSARPGGAAGYVLPRAGAGRGRRLGRARANDPPGVDGRKL